MAQAFAQDCTATAQAGLLTAQDCIATAQAGLLMAQVKPASAQVWKRKGHLVRSVLAIVYRAVRENDDFRNLIMQWQRQRESGKPEPDDEDREARRLQAAVYRVAMRLRLPPHGPPLIKEDGRLGIATARAIRAGSLQDTGGATRHSFSRSSPVGTRAQRVAPIAQGRAVPPSNWATRIGRAAASAEDRRQGDERPHGGASRGGCCTIS
jgi:hypothetical protein